MTRSPVRMPFRGFVPPPTSPQAPRPGEIARPGALDFESYNETYAAPRGAEITVFTTSRPWRGIDVYLSAKNPIPLSGVSL